MTRKFAASLTILLIATIIMLDSFNSDFNPYNAPAAFAFGSGVQGGGAFCGELPE